MISLIIVNHNGQRFLKRLLDTITNQKTSFKYEVIFVDTESTDNSITFVKEFYKDVRVLCVKNLGFGSAVNHAVKISRGEYLAFFNEDMYFPPDFLESMGVFLNTVNKAKLGAIGCKIIDFDSDPKKASNDYGGKIDIFGFPQKNTSPKNIFTVNGSPFFISKNLFNQVGGYNPNIFLYGEDVDFAWRLILLGKINYMNNNTWIYHFGGGSVGPNSPQKMSNMIYGSLIPIFTCFSATTLVLISIPYLLLIAFLNIALLIKFGFNVKFNIELFKKYLTFFKNFRKINQFRNHVQKNRVLSDYQIFKYFSATPSLIYNLVAR
jgi:hypothetical protein